MISTWDLSTPSNIERIRALSRALAMLEAILSPDWEGRYYSFNSRWAPKQEMASMRNGEGDEEIGCPV